LAPFHCHRENATGVSTLCRGWVSCHQFESVAVRLACCMGLLDPSQVAASCPVPLYANGSEACAAGMAGVERPDKKARVAIAKLAARFHGKP
jgi:hypothetical protein